MLKTIAFATMISALPVALLANGEDSSPPKPTETTKQCWGKRVWDEKKQRCVRPKQSSLNQDQLYDAVRELAYAGRYDDAQGVLDAMDQDDDRVLTYWGFTSRKLGDVDAAMAFYATALNKNPDNMLARSYLGQHLVETGDLEGAQAQLAEIETRGAGYSWPATSLRQAIYAGRIFNY